MSLLKECVVDQRDQHEHNTCWQASNRSANIQRFPCPSEITQGCRLFSYSHGASGYVTNSIPITEAQLSDAAMDGARKFLRHSIFSSYRGAKTVAGSMHSASTACITYESADLCDHASQKFTCSNAVSMEEGERDEMRTLMTIYTITSSNIRQCRP
jgi:hypothetical protein